MRRHTSPGRVKLLDANLTTELVVQAKRRLSPAYTGIAPGLTGAKMQFISRAWARIKQDIRDAMGFRWWEDN